MQTLTEHDYKKINGAIKAYNHFGHKMKAAVAERCDKAWWNAFEEYQNRCKNTPAWLAAMDFVTDYETVTNFNMDSHFEINLGTSDERCRVFNMNLYRDYIDAYQHLDAYRTIINHKIAKLDHKRFIFGKKLRIAFLKNHLKDLENEATQYADWKRKDEMKNDYIGTKTTKYHEAKRELSIIQNQIATEVVRDSLHKSALLVCKAQSDVLNASFNVNGNTYFVNSHPLNLVCHHIRQDAMNLDHVTTLSR